MVESGTEQQNQKPLTVAELTTIIENSLTDRPELQNTLLAGEITNFTRHSSGHIYFSLRDKDDTGPANKKSQVRCTFFKFQNQSLNFTPKQGMEVLVRGGISVYRPSGQYSFNVKAMMQLGMGNLLLKIQQLKTALIEKGIIDPESRKSLPYLPKRIGIVTGIGTAALRDILKQVKDRYQNIEILIAPAKVQGDGAAESIAAAVDEISKTKWQCEVIIVGRGGGGPEDLMPFNEEPVAMAIHRCKIPVVSAVGHQIDHPISDDVADVAAATPTDAGKLVLPQVDDISSALDNIQGKLDSAMQWRLTHLKEILQRYAEKRFFQEPMSMLQDNYLRLDDLDDRISLAIGDILANKKEALNNIPDIIMKLELLLSRKKNALEVSSERLLAFSPLATLKRGYSMVYQKSDLITDASQVNHDEELTIQFATSTVKARPITT